ncbi:beta-hexosaminidase [Aeromonas diversa CDC 2478-85]|uniref:beta-N-acetylhexosaminidase n=1 Tax=Aeromonas diversa CDC 2478-85 TaxID=1268237 RepID=N9VEC4_9GAMM|nr:beta-N-acetylhexosaminidase [Aeromonas diversa]ENY73602.1 beta-hexosaminidase [Aeromonas diversa CDC 2478-85]
MSAPLIDLDVIRREGNDVWLRMTLTERPPVGATLHFCLARYLAPDSLQGGTLQRQVGSYKVVTLAPDSLSIEFCCPAAPAQRLSDLPQGCYLGYSGPQSQPALLPLAIGRRELRLPPDDTHHPGPGSRRGAGRPGARPRHWRLLDGEFRLPERAHVAAPEPIYTLLGGFNELTGLSLRQDHDALIHLHREPMDEEAYRLRITPTGITIVAGSSKGWRHALMSLAQWVLQHGESLPCIEVEDAPRFGFRGLFLDCARHFHSVATIKRLLTQMALFKFNHFHWHLTDDEGWRLEIKAFPALTEVGAWRGHDLPVTPQLSGGPAPYGGYYTQSEVREVVAHAATLGITVIPEIDIPGHCHAAIKALPALLTEPADGSRYRSVQFFEDNVLNPALPGTYTFLEAVLDEVCELFPGPLIHMGGDEVPEGVWTDSPACHAFMAQHGYQDPKELQGHLLRHCQHYLAGKGKQMAGWEEMQHGDKVSREAAVWAWTRFEAGLAAAAAGFPVVMAPAQYLYLDLAWSEDPAEPGLYWAGTLDLRTLYDCDPAPTDFHAHDNILGILSPLWSEHIISRERLDYMLYPRLLASAEVAWSMMTQRSWQSLCARLPGQLRMLDRMGVAYRPLRT